MFDLFTDPLKLAAKAVAKVTTEVVIIPVDVARAAADGVQEAIDEWEGDE